MNKFRVYDRDLKRFAYFDELKFFRGNKSKVFSKWGFEGQLVATTPTFYASGDDKAPVLATFTNFSIDRFTGLCDDYNREIYENDIVEVCPKVGALKDRQPIQCDVLYHHSYASFVVKRAEYISYINKLVLKIKIIGNKYE